MHPLLNIADRAARDAGKIIIRALERLDAIKNVKKKYEYFITETFQQAERVIIETIHNAYPNHYILTKESDDIENNNEYIWIVKPIDGIDNFTHNFSCFSIAIAVKYRDSIEQSLVYAPLHQETFTATRGEGARLNNNHRLRVSMVPDISEAVLNVDFPLSQSAYLDYFKILNNFLFKGASIRSLGSSLLSLAYVAAGRMDGIWVPQASFLDIAAGALLIKEAGGLLSDRQGGEEYLKKGNILAANPKLFKSILQIVHQDY